jgi:RimJ/RimL family protein N-acetyltransferase
METPFGESIGTISVYDINDNEGEVGRFCSFGSPFSNIEGCIMLYDFCFDILKLHKVKIWVYEDNKPVIELDQSFGYQWVGNTVAQDGRLCRVGEMTPSQYMEKRTEIAKKLKLKEKYF